MNWGSFKIEGAEGSLRKLWRQKFRPSSVSSLVSTRSPVTSLTLCSGELNSGILLAVQLLSNHLTSWLAGFLERVTIRRRTAQRLGPRPEAGRRLAQVATSP